MRFIIINFLFVPFFVFGAIKTNDPTSMYSLPLETGLESFSCEGQARLPQVDASNKVFTQSVPLIVSCTYKSRGCTAEFHASEEPRTKNFMWKKPIETSMRLFSDMYLSRNRVTALKTAQKNESGWFAKTKGGTPIRVNSEGSRMWVTLNGQDLTYRLGKFENYTVVTGTKLAMKGSQIVTAYSYKKLDGKKLYPSKLTAMATSSTGERLSGHIEFARCSAY